MTLGFSGSVEILAVFSSSGEILVGGVMVLDLNLLVYEPKDAFLEIGGI